MKKTDRTKATKTAEQPPEQPAPQGVQLVHVTNLAQGQAACDRLIHVKVVLPGPNGIQILLIPTRLLRPDETEKLELILKEAHPPLKEVAQADGRREMQYVPDPETLEKSAHLQRVARALALWWACPIFRESDDGKKLVESGEKRDDVFAFIQSKFTDSILEKVYQVARAQEFQLEDRVNFTTPPA